MYSMALAESQNGENEDGNSEDVAPTNRNRNVCDVGCEAKVGMLPVAHRASVSNFNPRRRRQLGETDKPCSIEHPIDGPTDRWHHPGAELQRPDMDEADPRYSWQLH